MEKRRRGKGKAIEEVVEPENQELDHDKEQDQQTSEKAPVQEDQQEDGEGAEKQTSTSSRVTEKKQGHKRKAQSLDELAQQVLDLQGLMEESGAETRTLKRRVKRLE